MGLGGGGVSTMIPPHRHHKASDLVADADVVYFRAGDLARCPTRSPRLMGVLRKRLKGGQRRTGGCIIRMVECWGGGVLCAQVIVRSMRRMRSFEHKVEDMKAGTGVCTRAAASARRPKKSTRCFL